MWWLSSLRVLSSCAALGGAALSGSYYFVQLRDTCGPTGLRECIFPTEKKTDQPIKALAKPGGPEKAATKSAAQGKAISKPDEREKAMRPVGQGPMWSQSPASEELLIWSGHRDGEVGRIAPADFEKAAKNFQAS